MAKKTEEKKGFEAYLQEIEDIVEKLESGELSLDEAIKYYENGMQLAAKCEKALKDAKIKIEVLKKKTGGGYATEPLDEETDEDEEDEDDDNGGKLPF
jgi:exodeoxyribonuclease VII small subunit